MISVLIHGPLKSYGIGPSRNASGYDCSENIAINTSNAKNLDLEVFLSISFNSSQNKVSSQNTIDYGQTKTIFFDSAQIIEPDNRIKQRMGLSNALTQIRAQTDVPYILIIRTDMLLPISFWDWVKGLKSDLDLSDFLGIFCSELNAEPFYIGDFIFFSRIEKLEKMLGNVLVDPGVLIHPISNCELGLSILSDELPPPLNRPGLNIFNFLHRFVRLRKPWFRLALGFGTIPRDIYAQIEWRGTPMREALNLDTFQFKNPGDTIVIESRVFQLILSYNYFNSRYQQAGGRSISVSIVLDKFRNIFNVLVKK
jgi:hypothetical protein